MNIIKKITVIFVVTLIVVSGLLPVSSYAAQGTLSDAQRKGLVDTIVKIIDEGNKSRTLRYSQDHRVFGYDFRKVTKNTKQTTSGYTNLTDADLIKVKQILMKDLGMSEEDFDDIYEMPKAKAYKCNYTGADIKDTMPYDCSSLVSAAYNYAVGTSYSYPWCSGEYSKSTKWFSVSSDMSNLKPGDILWKEGHVALYLGDYDNTGVLRIAEASGFAGLDKHSSVMRQRLLEFLEKNPKFIRDHPKSIYNEKVVSRRPTLQLPENAIRDVTKQVQINVYKPGRFKKVATYIGPISEGRFIDVTNLKTTNPGNNSVPDDDNSEEGGSQVDTSGDGSLGNGGLTHDPIVLPGTYTVVWPKDMILEDQNLATSEGYFYKGTPAYGQYVGRIDMFNWLIEGSSEVLDWLVGSVTYGVKSVLIGWTAIMENVTSNILNFGIKAETNSGVALLTDKSLNLLELDKTETNNDIPVLTKVSSETKLSAYTDTELYEKLGVTHIATLADFGQTQDWESTVAPTIVKTDSEIDASETKKKITIEDVLFNRVPVLDINFFDFENAGGQKLEEGSLLYKIRETISGWYYVIRMAVIMGMLVALIYVAIKIAISMPGKKAEYKAKLIDWLVGFIIVFFIHYFMLAVISFNNQIVKVLDPIAEKSTTVETPKVESGSNITTSNDGQTSLYEAIRIQSYDVKATTGITATIMYMVLVFFMIRFVVLYAKRMFVIAVLTVVSPVMALMHSINRKKYKIGDWGKEYIYNVLIQFIHVVIYTAIIGLAFDLTKTSTFRGGIIALMTLAFLMGAEELVKKIFGFGKASTSGSLANSALGTLAAVGVAKSIYKKSEEKGKKAADYLNSDNNWFRRKYYEGLQKNMSVSDWANKYAKPEGATRTGNNGRNDAFTVDENGNVYREGQETDQEARERRAKRVLDSKGYKPNTTRLNGREYIVDKNGVPIAPYEPIDPDREKYFNMSTINIVLEEAMKEERKARSAYALQGLKDIWNVGTGSVALMASVPMLVISPKYGLGLSAYGIHSFYSSMGRKKIKGAKPSNNSKKWTGKRLVFAFATGGISEGIANMYNNSADTNYVLQTNYAAKIELLKKARETEDQLAREIVELELERKLEKEKAEENVQETEKVKEAKEKIEQVARDMDKQEFEKAVNITLGEIKKKDIEKVVSSYLVKKEGGQLTSKDIENISRDLGKRVESKYNDLTLNSEFSDIVRDEIRDRVVTISEYIVVENDSKTKPTVEDNSAASIRDKYSRGNKENEEENTRTSMFGKDMTHVINGKLDNIDNTSDNGRKEKVQLHLKDREENRKRGNIITKRELEKEIDDIIKNMNQEELVDVIDASLKRRGAINREIKNPKYIKLMRRVEELKKINSEYEKLTGEEIYKQYEVRDNKRQPKRNKSGKVQYEDVGNVVKDMRNYLVDYINTDTY